MGSGFDGLRAILWSRSALVSVIDAPAVEAESASGADDLSGLAEMAGPVRSPNAPLLNDVAALEIDDAVFEDAAPRTQEQLKRMGGEDNDGRVGVWAAVADLVFGLVLGATAAITLFRSDVARILARLG